MLCIICFIFAFSFSKVEMSSSDECSTEMIVGLMLLPSATRRAYSVGFICLCSAGFCTFSYSDSDNLNVMAFDFCIFSSLLDYCMIIRIDYHTVIFLRLSYDKHKRVNINYQMIIDLTYHLIS